MRKRDGTFRDWDSPAGRFPTLSSDNEKTVVTLRRATWRDCWRLWRWRNHPSTRAMMRHTHRIGVWEHVRWFRAATRDADHRVMVAVAKETAVGSVRLESVSLAGLVDIDVIVAPRHRGAGHAAIMIACVVDLAGQCGARGCRAVIRLDNLPSRRAFTRAGFTTKDAVGDWVVMERAC